MSEQPPSAQPVYNQARNQTGLLSPAAKVNIIILCVLLLIFSGLLLTEFLTNIVTMLAASLILTYILLSPVDLIDKALSKLQIRNQHLSPRLSRALAILVVYLLFLGMVVISVFRLAPLLSLQVKEFARDIPNYLSRVSSETRTTSRIEIGGANQPLTELVTQSLEESRKQQQNGYLKTSSANREKNQQAQPEHKRAKLLSTTYTLALQKLIAGYKQHMSKLGGFILDIGTTTLSGVIYSLTTLVLVFYLLHDGKELKKGLTDLMPLQNEQATNRFLSRLHLQFHSIIRGQVLMSFLAGGLMYLLLLIINVKYALLLGVFFGAASILPVIGPWIGLFPIIALIAFSSHPIDILQVLLATGLFYICKTYWIWPQLIHHKYDIHPILFILTFVICLKLVGLMGILLSFPLTSMLAVAAHTIKAGQNPKTVSAADAPDV